MPNWKKMYNFTVKIAHQHEKAFIKIPDDQHRAALGPYLLHYLHPGGAHRWHDAHLPVYRNSFGVYPRDEKLEEMMSSARGLKQKVGGTFAKAPPLKFTHHYLHRQ